MRLEEFESLVDDLSNWGRWGDADERGALNHICADSLRRGAACVRDGVATTLSLPLDLHGPQDGVGVPGRINPLRTMLGINTPMGSGPDAASYNDDLVVTPTQAATHWDALSHTSWRGRMYNGVPADTVTVRGARRLGIDAFGPVVTRGVLLDVARDHRVDRLPGGTEITRAMLEGCAERQGVVPTPGDVVLIRTGHLGVFRDGDVHGYHASAPGLGIDTAAFFQEHSIAAAATDIIAFELLPSKLPEVFVPLHVLCHVMMGMPLGENFDLDALADACATDGRYAFLLDATPLSMTHSTGGMVNPVAIR